MDPSAPMTQVANHALAPISLAGLTAIVTGFITPAIGFLGACAVLFWYCLQIYKDSTVQLWLRTRRLRRIEVAKKLLAHLEARERAELHKGD